MAKVRETSVVQNRNGSKETTRKEGVFYRTSDGTTLTRWTTVNGVPSAGVGEMYDSKNGITYRLSYQTHTGMQSPKAAPLQPDYYSKITPSGEDSVEGIKCNLIPIEIGSQTSAPVPAGQLCASAEYGLRLKENTHVTRGDGSVVDATFEMYDIKLNETPDSHLFDIGQFTISKK
jgi:hypothetical protein